MKRARETCGWLRASIPTYTPEEPQTRERHNRIVRIVEEITAANSQIVRKCSSTTSQKLSQLQMDTLKESHTKKHYNHTFKVKTEDLEGSTRVVILPFKGSSVRSAADSLKVHGGQNGSR